MKKFNPGGCSCNSGFTFVIPSFRSTSYQDQEATLTWPWQEYCVGGSSVGADGPYRNVFMSDIGLPNGFPVGIDFEQDRLLVKETVSGKVWAVSLDGTSELLWDETTDVGSSLVGNIIYYESLGSSCGYDFRYNDPTNEAVVKINNSTGAFTTSYLADDGTYGSVDTSPVLDGDGHLYWLRSETGGDNQKIVKNNVLYTDLGEFDPNRAIGSYWLASNRLVGLSSGVAIHVLERKSNFGVRPTYEYVLLQLSSGTGISGTEIIKGTDFLDEVSNELFDGLNFFRIWGNIFFCFYLNWSTSLYDLHNKTLVAGEFLPINSRRVNSSLTRDSVVISDLIEETFEELNGTFKKDLT